MKEPCDQSAYLFCFPAGSGLVMHYHATIMEAFDQKDFFGSAIGGIVPRGWIDARCVYVFFAFYFHSFEYNRYPCV